MFYLLFLSLTAFSCYEIKLKDNFLTHTVVTAFNCAELCLGCGQLLGTRWDLVPPSSGTPSLTWTSRYDNDASSVPLLFGLIITSQRKCAVSPFSSPHLPSLSLQFLTLTPVIPTCVGGCSGDELADLQAKGPHDKDLENLVLFCLPSVEPR